MSEGADAQREACFSQAFERHQAGDLAGAELLYRRVLVEDPRHVDALQLLGTLLTQSARGAEGIVYLRQAVEAAPNVAWLHESLGDALRALGSLDAAAVAFEHGAALDPSGHEVWGKLGIIRQAQGKHPEALAAYHRALSLEPRDAVAWHNLGVVERLERNYPAADQALRRALELQPQLASGWLQLGIVQIAQQRPIEAEASLRRAVELEPRRGEHRKWLGMALGQQGRYEEVLTTLREAIALDPRDAEALHYLGVACNIRDELAEGTQAFHAALALRPDHAPTLADLGIALAEQGDIAGARGAYERALSLGIHDGVRLRLAMLTPPIPESVAEIATERQALFARIHALREQSLHVDDPVDQVCKCLFYPAYHGEPERPLQEAMADLFCHAVPALKYVAPHCRSPRSIGPRDQVRVALVSRYFFKHSIGLHYARLVRELPRDRLHVTVVRFPAEEDQLAREIQASADRVVKLTGNFTALRDQLANEAFDVICYTDVGMNPTSYFLASLRLAPVQCVLPGHPVTTGLATIDDYISSSQFEVEEADEHYTERLVRLSHLPHLFTPPAEEPLTRTRAEFGLPAEGALYSCPQMPFKIHPDFDRLAGAILRADPTGTLVLIHDRRQVWSPRLLERLRRHAPDVAARIVALPRLKPSAFFQWLQLTDCLLDSPHFNGGTTSCQAFSLGVPVVTWPSRFLRGRTTAALARLLDVPDLIATDFEDYVRRAIRLAHDRAWRADLRGRLLVQRQRLVDNRGFVDEFAHYLIQAAQRARGKETA